MKKRRDAKEEGIEDPELAGFDENYEFTEENLEDASLDEFDFADEEANSEDELNDDLLSGIGSSEEADADVDETSDTVAQTSDVIGEAEIYIAYGRFDQAADLLKNSIQQEPSRLDLRMKLLEVYVETDDAELFAEAELDLNGLGDVASNEKAAVMRSRLTSPIDGTVDSLAGSSPLMTDLMSEHAPEMGIESLADADDEFADGIDFEAALDLGDAEEGIESEEGQDFAASLDALDGFGDEEEISFESELDSDAGIEFDLSDSELDLDLSDSDDLDDVPTLELDTASSDEVPTLDDFSELETLGYLPMMLM